MKAGPGVSGRELVIFTGVALVMLIMAGFVRLYFTSYVTLACLVGLGALLLGLLEWHRIRLYYQKVEDQAWMRWFYFERLPGIVHAAIILPAVVGFFIDAKGLVFVKIGLFYLGWTKLAYLVEKLTYDLLIRHYDYS